MSITLQNILLTTKLHFANISAKGPTFTLWWPRFKETHINGSALDAKGAVRRPCVSIVLGCANADELK